jgi:hypothetical protein
MNQTKTLIQLLEELLVEFDARPKRVQIKIMKELIEECREKGCVQPADLARVESQVQALEAMRE